MTSQRFVEFASRRGEGRGKKMEEKDVFFIDTDGNTGEEGGRGLFGRAQKSDDERVKPSVFSSFHILVFMFFISSRK